LSSGSRSRKLLHAPSNRKDAQIVIYIKLFEIGNSFKKIRDCEINSFIDFAETQNLFFIISGKEQIKGWDNDAKETDFYLLKSLIDSFLSKISLDNVLIDSYYSTVNEIYAYNLTKSFKETELGRGGRLNDKVLKQFDINHIVYCFKFVLLALKAFR